MKYQQRKVLLHFVFKETCKNILIIKPAFTKDNLSSLQQINKSDDLRKKRPLDASKIRIHEAWEVHWDLRENGWKKMFGK